MTPPLILMGAQRSGTTALAYALSDAFASAGGIFTVNGKLPYLLRRWCTDEDLRARHFRADEVLYALKRRPATGAGSEKWAATTDAVLRDLAGQVAAEGPGGRSAKAVVLRVMKDAHAGWTRWGDKYNEYLTEFDSMLSLLPEAQFILLIRDPRDVARSVADWDGDRPWKPRSIADTFTKWESWHQPWIRSGGDVPQNQRLVVHYEHLCNGSATRRLSEFIGLDMEPHVRNLKSRRPAIEHTSLPASTRRVWQQLTEMESA